MLQVDISGTLGHDAWEEIKPFSAEQGASFGPDNGSGSPCLHEYTEPHLPGEWWGAVVIVESNFMADFALPHYLDQPRVLDAYIEDVEEG